MEGPGPSLKNAEVWMTDGQWLVQDHWVRISLRRWRELRPLIFGQPNKEIPAPQGGRWNLLELYIFFVRFFFVGCQGGGGRCEIIKVEEHDWILPLFGKTLSLVSCLVIRKVANHTWHVHEFHFFKGIYRKSLIEFLYLSLNHGSLENN